MSEKLKNQINLCLNNEVGGPNLENMIGICLSMGVLVALYKLAKIVYSWAAKAANVTTKYEL